MKLVIAFLFSCLTFAQPKSDSITFIFKKSDYLFKEVPNQKRMTTFLNYSEFGQFKEVYLSPQNKEKDDVQTVAIQSDKLFLIHYWQEFHKVSRVVVYKGDTLVVDYSKGYPEFSIPNRVTKGSDLNLEQNENLHFPMDSFQFFLENKRSRNKKELQAYEKELADFSVNYSSRLEQLYTSNQLSKDVYEGQRNYMNYYLLNTDSNTSFKKHTADLKSEELIWLKSYRYFLEKYVQSEFKVKQITKELKDVPLIAANNKTKTHDVKFKKDDYEDTFLQVEASNLFSPKAKEFLLYVYLNQIAKSESHKLSEYVTIFKKYSTDPILLDAFEKAFLVNEESLKKVVNEVVLWDSTKNKTTLEEVLLQNKGKVIYVDFWASWCGPCRAAFPASRALHKKYPQVVFLYLSTDANFEAWKKANAFEQLEANSYLILNNKTSEYLLSLKIDFIPRYLIIDSNGVLVNANAPGANTDTIEAELKKYLNN